MTYTINWLIPRRVIRVRFQDSIGLDDLATLQANFLAFVEAGTAPVHLLVDFVDIQDFPVSLSTINFYLPRLDDARLGATALIGGSRLLRSLAGIVVKLWGKRLQICANEAEALALLARQDTTLNV